MENSVSHSLHHFQVRQLRAIFNIAYSFLYFSALTIIIYYRGTFFLTKRTETKIYIVSYTPWLIIFVAELLYSFLWIINQPMQWRPITRTVFPENLPKNEELPRIDVLICTADPNREPTFKVMNTVVSAMTLDYPADKLSVYLSDDGGAFVTLNAIKEAWVFATWWLPFCRKYNVKTICPLAYFQNPQSQEDCQSEDDFIHHRNIVQEKYEAFKQRVQLKKERGSAIDNKTTSRDHPPLIQVIDENSLEEDASTLMNLESGEMPLLVYVAREKRPSHPHNFKAGAVNTLLRVSSILSNSPYILLLDCDMYCNDPMSARRAMCFYLDPKISPSLGWVQYPQKFHNISETDIYNSQMREIWSGYWEGADGLQGPTISGTNFYLRRKALYDINIDASMNLKELKESLGPSNELIKSLSQHDKPTVIKGREKSSVLLQEAHFLASCPYEEGTGWGQKVGFQYGSIVEDVKTSIILQSKGWRSVYLNPPRPQFLGSATTTLNDMLLQGIRWYGGLAGIGLSKYCPLIYKPSRMHILQKMYKSWIAFIGFDFLPVLCFAIIPPICFTYGIPLYPKLSDPFFIVFAFVFTSSQLKYLSDIVIIGGGSIKAWLNAQRIWMVKCLTCYAYGTLDCVMTKLGFREATFTPTNKAGDDDTTNWYQLGKYDFRASNMFVVPIVTAAILNLCCFVGGVARLIVARNWDAMFAQMLFSIYLLVMSMPVFESILLRKDDARIAPSATKISTCLSLVFLILGYFILSFH
ncbi:hypothetical protein BVRB_4g087890 [Beta vulgaris subsp. vulgaris]|nr:hypothetical protein BVRB_4g087890 [Beta vulgaris subsp. vulgaris]